MEEPGMSESLTRVKLGKGTILVFREKHGDRYFMADSREALGEACFKVFKERFDEGWYASDFDEPEKPEVTRDELGSLPPKLQQAARDEIVSYERMMAGYKKQQEFAKAITGAVANGDRAVAIRVIESRGGYEYEGYRLEQCEDAKVG
jgi:hypothetical protein